MEETKGGNCTKPAQNPRKSTKIGKKINLITATKTKTGLTVRARLHKKTYKKGIKVSKEEMEKIKIHTEPIDLSGFDVLDMDMDKPSNRIDDSNDISLLDFEELA